MWVEVDRVHASLMKCDLKSQVISQDEVVVARYQCDGSVRQAQTLKTTVWHNLPTWIKKNYFISETADWKR
jgi:hypothetical protein